MKKTSILIMAIAVVAVAALGILAADEAPKMVQTQTQVQTKAAATTQAQFTYKHPLEILAEVSGKTVDEIRTLVAGKGVWAVVEELKVKDSFTKAFTSYKYSQLDYMVSLGRITKEQADAWKAEFAKKVAAGELGKDFAGSCGLNLGMGGGRGMRGGRGCGGCGMNDAAGYGFGQDSNVQGKGMMGGRWN